MPHLHLQLFDQLRQWITPADQRHLSGFAEIMAAILLSQSACLSRWIPNLSHRDCSARSHLERLSYFVHNPRITASIFYEPLLRHLLEPLSGSVLDLTLDTSVFWDEFCLIEVCLVWGGRSITLSQVVLEHGSATVGFEQYRPVLEQALALIPARCSVSILADRGFLHHDFIQWTSTVGWSWTVRGKVDTTITLASGRAQPAQAFCPPPGEAVLVPHITVLDDIPAHLAVANVPQAQEPWIVLSDQPPSLQSFARYGRRFGGVEPHFKDYKSAAFRILDTRLRDAQALTCLVMLLDCATLLALVFGLITVQWGQRGLIDWHAQRGLSFLQLGLRAVRRWFHRGEALPQLIPLAAKSPPTAYASKQKHEELDGRIEFSRVVTLAT
jgi:hypothetical protein